MIGYGTIDWWPIYMSLIATIMLVLGATWCISPKGFVKAHRALIFRNKVTGAKWWESAVCSNSGRACGAMIACFAVFILFQLWIVGFR